MESLQNLTNTTVSEQRLKETQLQCKATVEAILEGVIIIRSSGEIISATGTVESIFGYSEAELIDSNINKLIPLSRHRFQALNLNASPDEAVPDIVGKIKKITEGVCKDGSSVPLDVSMAGFSIDGASYLTCIVRDVRSSTDREPAGYEHRDEAANIARLGLMASAIAHDISQPLMAIASYSQACLNLIQNGRFDQDKISDILKKTIQQSLRAGQMIHRMRDIGNL